MDNNTILLAEMRNSNPLFRAVANIWLHERLAFFVFKLFGTVNFSAFLGAFEMKEKQLCSGLFLIEANDLLMTTVMHIYRYEGAMFICPYLIPMNCSSDFMVDAKLNQDTDLC